LPTSGKEENAVRFCDLAQFMHEKYEVRVNAGEFVAILIDAILDDEALEKDSPNPIYGLKKSTKEAYYSGRLSISQKRAAQIVPRLSEEKFAEFVNDYSMDALDYMRDKLSEFGFDVPSYEVGQACANILAQIIKRRSEGLSDDVTKLNYKRMESGQLLKNIAPASIERRGDKLHIAGEIITINRALVPDNIAEQELDYIRALYEVFAEKLKMETFTSNDVQFLPKSMKANYREQRKAYYSAVSIERSVRDVFDDGEDEFQKLKDDAWDGINTTYWREYPDGYARLNAVLEKITNTSLDGSVLSQMRSLIGNLEKKGICHILVNDGVIESWVSIDD
jgi:hypothetical protein